MLRFQEDIDLRDDIHPSLLSICDWEPSVFQDTIYNVPLTKGEYDKMVTDCESEIIFEHLEGMFGITPETFNYTELMKHPFFLNHSIREKEYYLDIILFIMNKYNTIENSVDLYYSYQDEDSFDHEYDQYPVPEECEHTSSSDDENGDENEVVDDNDDNC